MKKFNFLLAILCMVMFANTSFAQGADCASATAVMEGTTTAPMLTGTPSQADANAAVWYTYTPANTGSLTVASCDGGADTRVFIHDGTCAALNQVGTNDDACADGTGTNYASELTVSVVGGTTYYIEWDDRWSANGFDFTLTYSGLPDFEATMVRGVAFTRLPATQAPATGVPLTAIIANPGTMDMTATVTVSVATAADPATPIYTSSSPATTVASFSEMEIEAGTWVSPMMGDYIVDMSVAIAEMENDPSDNASSTAVTITANQFALDDDTQINGLGSTAAGLIVQGQEFAIYEADEIVSADVNIGGGAAGDSIRLAVYNFAMGAPNAVIASSEWMTLAAAGSGFVTMDLMSPLAVVAGGRYLFALEHIGTGANIAVGYTNEIFEADNAWIGAPGDWSNPEDFGFEICYMIRPNTAVLFTVDDCGGAMDVNGLLGGGVGNPMTSGIVDNFNATTDASDPTTGWECFGEPDGSGSAPSLETTLWFTFTGDGELYHIETVECGATDYIDDGDTQMAIYAGSCGALTAVECNEDVAGGDPAGPYPAGLDFQTQPGVTYYIMIDAFNFNGAVSDGEFCLEFTQQPPVDCAQISIGEYTGTPIICFNENTSFEFTTDPVIPNVGPNSGLLWIVSTEDISGSMDPSSEASFAGNFGASGAPYTPALANTGTPLPAGLWYFTPFVYGAAVDTSAAQDGAFGSLDIANAECAVAGASFGVTFVPELQPLAVTLSSTGSNSNIANGDATATVTEGSTVYNYAWDNGGTTATISDIAPGTYTVTVSDATGCVADVVQSVEVENLGVAAGNLEVVENISISPNPTNGFVKINLETVNTEAISLQVLNVTGQVVKAFPTQTTNATQYDLDLSDLAEGVYFAKFTIGNKVVVENIILAK